MAKVRSENSKVELIVFKYLSREKIYFQKHYKRIIGSPDIALPRRKKAVFIDGDFWHGNRPNVLKNRKKNDYWVKKVYANVVRDRKIEKELKANDWKIIRIWESDILRKRTQKAQLEKIAKFLKT